MPIELSSKNKITKLGFIVSNLGARFSDSKSGRNHHFIGCEIKCPCGETKSFLLTTDTKLDINNETDLTFIYDQLYALEFNEAHMRRDGWAEEAIQCLLKGF